MNYIKGSALSPEQQQQAKRQFVNRYTGDHAPEWATKPRPDGATLPLQFADDEDWLAHSYFAVTRTGELDRRAKYYHGRPTWPNNPELRSTSARVFKISRNLPGRV